MDRGLTLARDLVAAHGGRLTFRSAPNQGTCFTVWLPKTLAVTDPCVAPSL